jgi:hypothetical protein
MFNLKPLTRDAIPRALEKAERYRLLNEPAEAESICLDVLQVDSVNQQALVLRLLAATDQFTDGLAPHRAAALDMLRQLQSEYERAYYSGVIAEREGKAHLHHAGHGARASARECFHEAMEFYERAEYIRPAGNDDALLRWNACARQLMHLPAHVEGETFVPLLE